MTTDVSYQVALNSYNKLPIFLKNKIDFLREKNVSDGTKVNMYRVFYKSIYPIEQAKNKDLSRFNRDDIIELIQSITTTSHGRLSNLRCIVSGYENWAIKTALNHSNQNPLQEVDLKQIAIINEDEIKNNYIQYSDIFNLWEIIKSSKSDLCNKVNYQNLALLLLIRLGLKGPQWSEVLYLKEEDIDFENNIINVTNRNEDVEEDKKSLKLIKKINIYDDRILGVLKNTIQQKSYSYFKKTRNGSKQVYIKYKNEEFIIKRQVGQTHITPSIFRSRLSDFFDAAERKYIPAKDLFKSAEIDMLLEFKNKSKFNKLHNSDFINVHNIFEPNSTNTGYVPLKKLYTSITDDYDILSDKWLVDKNGNRLKYIPDYTKYYDRRKIKRFLNRENSKYEKNITANKVLIEGGKVSTILRISKRTPNLRNLKFKDFLSKNPRLYCEVCGEEDEIVLDVHHDKIQVSEMESNHITKLKDLRIICANCHRKVHGYKITVDELIKQNNLRI